MAHYSSAEWLMYCRGGLDQDRRRRMERHLLRCDRCLNSYLELVGEREAEASALLLPPDFEQNLWRSIRRKQAEGGHIKKKRLLLNYAAAAVITLALTAGGVFEAIASGLPDILKETRQYSRIINNTIATGLSGELFNNDQNAD